MLLMLSIFALNLVLLYLACPWFTNIVDKVIAKVKGGPKPPLPPAAPVTPVVPVPTPTPPVA